MAYLAFHEIGGMAAMRDGIAAKGGFAAVDSASERLTQLEWSVVAVARNDRRSSLRAPGWLSTLTRLLFAETNPRLADTRLEALRRMAVLIWLDGANVSPDEIGALRDAGFTSGQIESVRQFIASQRQHEQGTVSLL